MRGAGLVVSFLFGVSLPLLAGARPSECACDDGGTLRAEAVEIVDAAGQVRIALSARSRGHDLVAEGPRWDEHVEPASGSTRGFRRDRRPGIA